MNDSVSVSFGWWAYNVFGPAIEAYSELLLDRVMPIFDDVDGEQERVSQSVLQSPGWGPDDCDQAMEAAYDAGVDRALQFIELRTVFLTIGVSGLFHMFEKQIYKHLNHELRTWLEKPITNWKDAGLIIEKLVNKYGGGNQHATSLQEAFFNRDIEELRLVANAIKHGEGRSYERLKDLGSEVVSDKRLSNDWTVGPFSVLGVKISVIPEDVKRYEEAALRFWRLEGTFWAPRSAFK